MKELGDRNIMKELSECFALLVAEYGDKLNEEQRINKEKLFKEIIGKYPINKVKQMTMEMIQVRKFANFPKIAEMRELIEGNLEEEIELAWQYLLEKIEDEGYYDSTSFPKYPVVGSFVENQGGWMRFCDTLEEELKWKKIEFTRLYPILKKRDKHPLKLPGYFEIENNNIFSENYMIKRYGRTLDGKKLLRRLLKDFKKGKE